MRCTALAAVVLAVAAIAPVLAGAAVPSRPLAAEAGRTWRLSYRLADSQLFSVAAAGPRSAWAVGYRTDRRGRPVSGLLHWRPGSRNAVNSVCLPGCGPLLAQPLLPGAGVWVGVAWQLNGV